MTAIYNEKYFEEFLKSKDTFRVYQGDRLVFSSQKAGLKPPLEYLEIKNPAETGITVFDRIIGNAAALLMTLIKCDSVVSELGSEMAVSTLDKAGIKHTFVTTVDYIRDRTGKDMCPMEKLSLNKTANQFHDTIKERIKRSSPG